jgi:signal recognition particle subunit SRP54
VFQRGLFRKETVSLLETLTRGFTNARQYLQGMRTLSEENLAEALRMIRVSLLEADVEFQVARSFLDRVKETALGEAVLTRVTHRDRKLSLSPGDYFIKLCNDELIRLMGPAESSLSFRTRPVSSVMMVGLQGCGKTTTAAKLAKYLVKQGKKPMLVAADVYRPAAVEQLRKLGADLDIPVFSDGGESPPVICEKAIKEAASTGRDLTIFDTAGRLTVDEPLMQELFHIQQRTSPDNVLLVCDAMIGQESVHVAKAFNERLALTGFILTKLDGDARGGAALSIKEATGVPIKFIGMGEGLDRLEEFRPDGLASRILGFGDVVGLVKDFEEVVDEKKAEEDALKMLKGQFNLGDFLNQIKTIKKMGPLQDLVERLPFFPATLPETPTVDDSELVRIEAIINSMTRQERQQPDIINESRMRRIAGGSGRSVPDVQDLLRKFKDMRDLMVAMGGGKIRGRWKQAKGLKKMISAGGFGGPMSPNYPAGAPFGLPEVASGRGPSRKELEKKKKRRKQERQARKKTRKR